MTDARTPCTQPGRTAYEAHTDKMRPSWESLQTEAQAYWARIEAASQAPILAELAQAKRAQRTAEDSFEFMADTAVDEERRRLELEASLTNPNPKREDIAKELLSWHDTVGGYLPLNQAERAQKAMRDAAIALEAPSPGDPARAALEKARPLVADRVAVQSGRIGDREYASILAEVDAVLSVSTPTGEGEALASKNTEAVPSDKQIQVADQCKVVAHMAGVLAKVHGDYEKLVRAGCFETLLDTVGKRTSELMEDLGDILNGMDAVSEDDDWTHPVFENRKHFEFERSAAPTAPTSPSKSSGEEA